MGGDKMAKKTRKAELSGSALAKLRHKVVTSDNDNLSAGIADIVPAQHEGTDRYLDVLEWNLEWFGATQSVEKDKTRIGLVTDILEALNGDLFVFNEIAGPSKDGRYPGALDAVAAELTKRGAGDYRVDYSANGGEQRVALMWDRTWLRARADVEDLFPLGSHKMPDGKDAFARRTPLYGYFAARVPVTGDEGSLYGTDTFDFQVLGVHLKAMADGHAQRLKSAEVLAGWLTTDAPKIDVDTMIIGDWNAPPNDKCWEPIHGLETAKKVAFESINDPDDFSYLWLANKSNKFVSRIDLTAISSASMSQIVDNQVAKVVRWKKIDDMIAATGVMTDKAVVKVMKELKESISDHMPTVTRFYFERPKADGAGDGG